MRPAWRTIVPDERGPNLETLSQEAALEVVGTETVLLRWTGEPCFCTVLASSPLSDSSGLPAFGDTQELQAILKYRNGGVSLTEMWHWGVAGWRRSLVASEVQVVAVRLDGGIAPRSPVRIAAAITLESAYPDELAMSIRGLDVAQPGAIPRIQRMPHGTMAWRAAAPSDHGTFETGFLDGAGTFTSLTTHNPSDVRDYRVWPSLSNAVRYNSTLGNVVATIEARS